ncbi:MAG: ATP synthase F1 subunit delta [Erysipelotrichaceae bacterium]|nr:ATP synthase F1 subunit delta [Erysipelotrichaceae bacterium]
MSQVSMAYAQGLLELAKEADSVLSYKEEIDQIKEVYLQNSELKSFFASAKISKDTKKELIEKAFKGKVKVNVLNFMKLLVDKGRMNLFLEIANDYHALSNVLLGIREGVVETARPISEEEITKLEKALSNDKTVVLKPRINETLISGFKVIFDDEVIDHTMKDKLEGLKTVLLERK